MDLSYGTNIANQLNDFISIFMSIACVVRVYLRGKKQPENNKGSLFFFSLSYVCRGSLRAVIAGQRRERDPHVNVRILGRHGRRETLVHGVVAERIAAVCALVIG